MLQNNIVLIKDESSFKKKKVKKKIGSTVLGNNIFHKKKMIDCNKIVNLNQWHYNNH